MSAALLSGLSQALSLEALLMTLIGVVAGITVGAIPGLTATMAVAVLVPFTFNMDAVLGLAMLLGIYVGGIYGGSISAILLRIPGTPSSIMTARDGYPLTQKGEAGRAIGISTFSSFSGGTLGIIALMIAAPLITPISLKFSAPELFMVALWGLSCLADVSGKNLVIGLISAALGILLGTVGMDPLVGAPRLTFGVSELFSGFEFVPVMIGLLGLPEIFRQIASMEKTKLDTSIIQKLKRVIPTWADIVRIKATILRGTLIGLWVGVLPGSTGGNMSSIMAYNYEVKVSKEKEKFGTGHIEGIAASESANNACVGGNLIPLLTLGIPGDSVTAILIGAFMIHNIQPGPMLYRNNPEIVYAIYASLWVAHLFMLIVGLFAARIFVRAISISKVQLIPMILVLMIAGAYSVNNNFFDVIVMLVFGVIGYMMENIDMPVAPMVLGLVLGPIVEVNLRTALVMSKGDFSIFFTRPICVAFWVLIALTLLGPRIADFLKRKRMQAMAG
ncbi:tripartite tricarboxylate transporter permease [Neomoorella mulderi]|uniref:Tripartite tricarboxylate transporter TctA family protein n=1 Tax=Moorella mulderi DSM 14980 TaxID=1122241 RepID=A0A151ASJ7_9FIRM|nr:tripartite tricarboxylate transporter permease [Moorella mulderi]KYH30562.1 tripartite tricarboxylate transporter TctA family protein [Moorella mulderi DSM 14980]